MSINAKTHRSYTHETPNMYQLFDFKILTHRRKVFKMIGVKVDKISLFCSGFYFRYQKN